MRIMRFKENMYDNWQHDLCAARDLGVISEHDLNWGRRALAENTLLVRKMGSFMRTNLLVLMALLPFFGVYFSLRISRLAPIYGAITKTSWTLMNGMLHYRAPRIHQKIRKLLGPEYLKKKLSACGCCSCRNLTPRRLKASWAYAVMSAEIEKFENYFRHLSQISVLGRFYKRFFCVRGLSTRARVALANALSKWVLAPVAA